MSAVGRWDTGAGGGGFEVARNWEMGPAVVAKGSGGL